LKRFKGRARDERGAVAVEFALISFMLFMLVFGIIQFGLAYSKYQVFLSAAREGARFAAVRCGTSAGCVPGQVAQKVQDSLTQGYTIDPGPVAASQPPCTANTVGSSVTVSWPQKFIISVPFLPTYTTTVTIKGVFRCE
jgi:Flp pilus assembly protein TadG